MKQKLKRSIEFLIKAYLKLQNHIAVGNPSESDFVAQKFDQLQLKSKSQIQ